MLLGKDHAAVAGFPDMWVNGVPTTMPSKMASVKALKPAPAMAGMLPPHNATPVTAALSADPARSATLYDDVVR
jgi:cell division septation protein DedD